MGKAENLASENRDEISHLLEEVKRSKTEIKEIPTDKKEVPADPKWRQRYSKATSRENLQIEDALIMDFLTNNRRRRGFIARNRKIKAAVEPLNRLERMLEKSIGGVRGRPRYDSKRIDLRLNPDFVKCIEDYSRKRGFKTAQAAIEWIIRDFLRTNGYPVT